MHRRCATCGQPLRMSGRAKYPVCSPRCHLELARKVRERHARRLGLPNHTQPVAHVKLEAGQRRLTAVPRWRRERFAQHLRGLLELAAQRPPTAAPAEEPEPLPVTPLMGNVCAFCRGGCCTYAQEHAYLNIDDAARLLHQFPQETATLVQQYLDHIPPKAYDRSCVFHAAKGCVLPREMRSAMCNRYECEGLAAVRHTVEPVLVSIQNERFAFVSETAVRPIRKPWEPQ